MENSRPKKHVIIKIEDYNFLSEEKINSITNRITQHKNSKLNNKYILEKTILQLKTKSKNWIIAHLDKNVGTGVLICQVLYKYICHSQIGKEKKY